MTNNQFKLTAKELKQMKEQVNNEPQSGILSRAIMQNGINQVAKDPKAQTRLNRTFSIDLKTDSITDQKHAGFCWMFAALNMLRHDFIDKYKIKGFEFSSNYLFFWDKIERANLFYTHMLETADRPLDDRTVSAYLDMPNDDGGEWDMAVALIEKYGLMPDSAFPRSSVTNDTDDFNEVMELKMHRDGMRLRNMANKDASNDEIKSTKHQMLSEVYRMVALSVGEPPKTFDLEYRDDKDKYHLDRKLTPKIFYEKYFDDIDLDDYVSIANYPDKKMNQLYQQSSMDNIEGGRHIRFLNLPMETLKKASIKQMRDGDPVFFGNDVTEQLDVHNGFLDSNLYHRDRLFNINLNMTKKERFQYKQAAGSHAMTFTGVDVIDNHPTKWRVENSWGDEVGKDGYFVMNDNWMNDFVYEVIVNKKYLSKDQEKMLDQKPIELPPWE